ncbi:hypothetical protein ACFL6D_03875, partial [Spirochaetota bacterium]
YVIDKLLEQYNRIDLKECIYSTMKELIINGIKANIKHTIFKEKHINHNSEKSLSKGLVSLKKLLEEKNLHELEKKAIENNLFIKLTIVHSPNRIISFIENNTEMTQKEDMRIREKFITALEYDNLADYYLNHVDEVEGMGLGITMIVLLLKGSNIDPHSFTIQTDRENITTAKIVFPISNDYVLERNTKNRLIIKKKTPKKKSISKKKAAPKKKKAGRKK